VRAGHFVCQTSHSVLVYRIPSRLRGVTERTWYHEFHFPGHVIIRAGIEPDEDLLVLVTSSVLQPIRSVVDGTDFSHFFPH
jgi:hypothetical protein